MAKHDKGNILAFRIKVTDYDKYTVQVKIKEWWKFYTWVNIDSSGDIGYSSTWNDLERAERFVEKYTIIATSWVDEKAKRPKIGTVVSTTLVPTRKLNPEEFL